MARIRRNSLQEDKIINVWKIGKYIRLSRDDGSNESESIVNQRKILDEQIPKYFLIVIITLLMSTLMMDEQEHQIIHALIFYV